MPSPTLFPPVIIRAHREGGQEREGQLVREKKKAGKFNKRRYKRPSDRLLEIKSGIKDRLLAHKRGKQMGRNDYYSFGRAFRQMDLDGDGLLSKEELAYSIGPKGMNLGLTKEETDYLYHELDADGSGEVDVAEFFHTLADLDQPDKHLWQILYEGRTRTMKTLGEKLAGKKPILDLPVNETNTVVAAGNEAVHSETQCTGRLANFAMAPHSATNEKHDMEEMLFRAGAKARRRLKRSSYSLPSIRGPIAVAGPRAITLSSFVQGERSNEYSFKDPSAPGHVQSRLRPKKLLKGRRTDGAKTPDLVKFSRPNPSFGCHSGFFSGRRVRNTDFARQSSVAIGNRISPIKEAPIHRRSVRRGAHTYTDQLRRQYAARDNAMWEREVARVRGRAKSKLDYMSSIFVGEVEALKSATRSMTKGALFSQNAMDNRASKNWFKHE